MSGEITNNIEIVKIAKDNKSFVISNRITVLRYSLSTGDLLGQWILGGNIINDIALSANGKHILLGTRSGDASVINTVRNTVKFFKKHRLDVNSVALSDDGLIALTGSSDKTAVLWQTINGETLQVLPHKTRVSHVSLNRDGTLAFTIDTVKERTFWTISSGERLSSLRSKTRFMQFNTSVFSDDNQWFLTGSPKQKNTALAG